IALFLAVRISQAAGRSGIPLWGHCSSAATKESWASSSAKPTSRTSRLMAAMTFVDSIRHTASMVRWMSLLTGGSEAPPGHKRAGGEHAAHLRLDRRGRRSAPRVELLVLRPQLVALGPDDGAEGGAGLPGLDDRAAR